MNEQTSGSKVYVKTEDGWLEGTVYVKTEDGWIEADSGVLPKTEDGWMPK